MSSLEKGLFRSFGYFSNELVVFLLLHYICCLYILEIKPLSVASFETIFSHSIGCLFFFFKWFPTGPNQTDKLLHSHLYVSDIAHVHNRFGLEED